MLPDKWAPPVMPRESVIKRRQSAKSALPAMGDAHQPDGRQRRYDDISYGSRLDGLPDAQHERFMRGLKRAASVSSIALVAGGVTTKIDYSLRAQPPRLCAVWWRNRGSEVSVTSGAGRARGAGADSQPVRRNATRALHAAAANREKSDSRMSPHFPHGQ